MPDPDFSDFDAIVPAGGAARRFGADKPAADLAGRSLLERVAAAVPDAQTLIIVGPPRPRPAGAVFAREEPPGAGPVPALRAGLAQATAPWTVLLAADLPFLLPEHVAAVRAAAHAHGTGAVLVDDGGREQWLAGCWHTDRLRAALAGYDGSSLRGLLGPLRPAAVALPGGRRPPWFDCDTPEALEYAQRIAEG
jgi:molybdopterin-guanine dinucleotide biosynthesis protein A